MKKFWNTDKIVSLSAMVVSLGSLVVITYQTNLIQNQTELIQQEQHTAVLPYLEMGTRHKNPDWIEIYLINSGLGPALIKEVMIRSGDKVDSVDIVTYFIDNYHWEGQLRADAVIVGELIPAGTDRTVLGCNPKDSAFIEFAKHLEEENANFEIVYESLYGEKWMLSFEQKAPIKLSD